MTAVIRAGRRAPAAPAAPDTSIAAPRMLAGVQRGRALSLADHVAVHGERPRYGHHLRSGPQLIKMVDAVGLRGRGGASFPLAAKLSAVAGQRGRAFVVVNGAESEPASRKDATLLGAAPHLVLDGAMTAAEVVGATEVVVFLHSAARNGSRAAAASAVEAAIDQRGAAGADPVPVTVEYGPPGYVAGQASAVVNFLSGRPALPTMSPPHATERGVRGRPTVVSNAETMAQLALLARHGPEWFRSVGVAGEPGTLLLTLTGAVRRNIVVEVPFGTPLGLALGVAGLVEQPHAVLVGGYAGSWLPWPHASGLPLTVRDLRAAGGTLGVGLIAVLPASRCGLAETAHLASWLAGQNAGQCGPCVNGLPAIASAMRALAAGTAAEATVRRLDRWSGMVAGRGLCHHPDGVVALVRSALRTFDREVGLHLDGWCSGNQLRPALPVPAPEPAAPAPGGMVRR